MTDVDQRLAPTLASLDDLRPHPRNYRGHPDEQVEHIRASLREHGCYRNVVCARDGTILAGHGVVEAARLEGMSEILVIRLDVDPDSPAAYRVLTGDNYISRRAEDDDRALTELLKQLVEEQETLLGTGFDEQQLAALVMITRPASEIADKGEASEWLGMPDYDQGEKELKAIVRFRSQADLDDFFENVVKTKPHVREGIPSIWWPPKGKQDLSSLEYQE